VNAASSQPPGRHRVIAIDGPAASGKSSVARALARRLGLVYVNTGAMYRAVTWLAVRKGVDTRQPEAVAGVLRAARMEFGVNGTESSILIDGEDPSSQLSDPEVNANVSLVAAVPAVREELVARQRDYAIEHDLVMEGRDIGSVVFPGTPYKFYVDASLEVRARRRAAQGFTDDLAARDRIDSSRATSPLLIAQGARVIDSSDLTVEGVVDEIVRLLNLQGFVVER
jgi:cytidylate kinase